jgi:membrane-associated protease RseP (regulator of RpoE activity)
MVDRNNGRGWIWGIAIAGVVLSVILSCIVGGLAGYLAGRGAARSVDFEMPFMLPEQRFQMPETAPDITPMPFMMGGGAVITAVTDGSPAEDAGLEVGDIIVAIDGDDLTDMSLADVVAGHEPGDAVTLTVQQGNQEEDIDVILGEHPTRAGAAWLGITYQEMPGLFDEDE